jgi:ketol-acid reductoisomerase
LVTIYTQKDAGPAALDGGRIAIVGFGAQAQAQASNLRDSGFDVVVGVRPGGASERKAKQAGFQTMAPSAAAAACDLVALLVPDMEHRQVYEADIAPNLKRGGTLLVAHGFSIHYRQIEPRTDIDVVLVAPKGPGELVRSEFELGRGVPCLLAVRQDATGEARARALSYAWGIGGTAGGAIETSFAEETETDLFGEQAILCGGAAELVAAGFTTLVEAGYQPEVAYFECLHELKQIVDLMYQGGIAGMLESVSDTARYGGRVAGPRIVNDETRARLRELLHDIQDGSFARDWIAEHEGGTPRFGAMIRVDRDQPIEKVGARLRQHMAWLASRPESEAA